jgi:flavin-binding protein dodecin
MSVYRVTEIIGVSKTGWEEAAREALAAARRSLRDLRVAEVVSRDITLDKNGAIDSYRTKVRLSFKFERPLGAPEWEYVSADSATGG